MEFMHLVAIFSGINLFLLGSIFWTYLGNYRKTKSSILISLMLFVALFFLHNVIGIYYYLTMMHYYVEAVYPQVFVQTVAQTAAFALLLYQTRK